MHTIEMYNAMKTLEKNQDMKDWRALVNKRKVIHGMGSTFTYIFTLTTFFSPKSQQKENGN